MASFASYAFNKSHAAAYAVNAVQTAWLKVHYPAEFMAALLTCEMLSIEKTVEYVEELRALGIPLLPPDVNKSEPTFSVEQQADGALAVRYALGAVKNVGMGPVEAIVRARAEGGEVRFQQRQSE